MESIFKEIKKERKWQDRQWGGPDHDDNHDPEDWLCFIEKFIKKAEETIGLNHSLKYRERLIQIASLAVAAVESYDRKNK